MKKRQEKKGQLLIVLRRLGGEPERFEGKLSSDLFDLGGEDFSYKFQDLRYDLDLEIRSSFLLCRGKIGVKFSCPCVVCLDEFEFDLRVDDLLLSWGEEEVFACELLDIAPKLREEVILRLPAHPKCGQRGLGAEAFCKNSSFRGAGEFEPLSEKQRAAPPTELWRDLDKLENLDK